MTTIDLIIEKYGYTIDAEDRVELTFTGWAPPSGEVFPVSLLGPFQFLPTQAGAIANRETGDVLLPPSGRIDMKRAKVCRDSLNQCHLETSGAQAAT